ncbi:uncharacterized protein KY384_000800 [Bacidia gigantensis]|uniref:uncharacterized protein n=1 Tax=Bacidia gigantensis TaxID=2732470 RepID=UPI001D041BEA|nr:uncharacterized protein KY384_000800 [Bacidia gigantensis]KAG8526038.1 hypothetical protein KY384_000800 [Bacidia gigantensis]
MYIHEGVIRLETELEKQYRRARNDLRKARREYKDDKTIEDLMTHITATYQQILETEDSISIDHIDKQHSREVPSIQRSFEKLDNEFREAALILKEAQDRECSRKERDPLSYRFDIICKYRIEAMTQLGDELQLQRFRKEARRQYRWKRFRQCFFGWLKTKEPKEKASERGQEEEVNLKSRP